MKVKNDVNIEDLTILHPSMDALISFLMAFCFDNNLPCIITSLIRPRGDGPHATGRGCDFSVKEWNDYHISKFHHQINQKYGYLGAISRSDKVQRVVVFHGEGNNFHGHLQCKP